MPIVPWGKGKRCFKSAKATNAEKTFVVKDGARLFHGVTEFCRSFNLSRATYYRWKNTLQNGLQNHDRAGRPSLVDEKGMKNIVEKVEHNRASGISNDVESITELLNNEAKSVALRRGLVHIQAMH